MKEFIYIKEKSIDDKMCDEIIELFESSEEHHFPGVVGHNYGITNSNGEVDITTKNTIDLNILHEKCICDSRWDNIAFELIQNVEKNLGEYISKMEGININLTDYYDDKCIDTLLLHKYKKNEGIFSYHNDYYIEKKQIKYRLLNYLWYLNDVDEGGETEFFGSYKIKPEKGKFLFFPSEWTFPHCGYKPISNDKYVISGWIYVNI